MVQTSFDFSQGISWGLDLGKMKNDGESRIDLIHCDLRSVSDLSFGI
jgi:hypothetical protein